MAWVVVDSTVIEKFRYKPNTSILEIEFKSGAVYHYFDVPSAVYEEFRSHVRSGGSAGQFFNTRIKEAYRFVKGPG